MKFSYKPDTDPNKPIVRKVETNSTHPHLIVYSYFRHESPDYYTTIDHHVFGKLSNSEKIFLRKPGITESGGIGEKDDQGRLMVEFMNIYEGFELPARVRYKPVKPRRMNPPKLTQTEEKREALRKMMEGWKK